MLEELDIDNTGSVNLNDFLRWVLPEYVWEKNVFIISLSIFRIFLDTLVNDQNHFKGGFDQDDSDDQENCTGNLLVPQIKHLEKESRTKDKRLSKKGIKPFDNASSGCILSWGRMPYILQVL